MQPEIQRSPLYVQVAVAMEKRLQDGVWPIDKALPPEPELASVFGVSIGTVRKAVESLIDRGLLVRHQGSGTFVRRYVEAGYWNRFQRFQTASKRLIRWEAQLKLFERLPATPEIASALKIAPGTEVIHTVRFMQSLNPEVCTSKGWDQSWLLAGAFTRLTPQAYEEYAHLSLYELYEKAAGVLILDVIDSLQVLETMTNPLDLSGTKEKGPFFLMTRYSRTFGNRIVEYRLSTPRCQGLTVVFNE